MRRWALRIIGITMLLISLFLLNHMQKMLLQMQQERGSAPAQ